MKHVLVCCLRYLVLLGAIIVLAGCSRAPASQSGTTNVLEARSPSRVSGAHWAARMTDGVAAVDGDAWQTDQTCVFPDPAAFVQYDLADATDISAAALQADNDDTYVVSGSTDGTSFTPFWEAGARTDTGLRWRYAENLRVRVRYVRVAARAGDGRYSVAELMLFPMRPEVFPPKVAVRAGVLPADTLRRHIAMFALVLALFLVFPAKARSVVGLIGVLALTTATVGLVWSFASLGPVPAPELSLLRAVLAGVSAIAVASLKLQRMRWLIAKWRIDVVLAVCALGAIGCYYNAGYPQFYDHTRERPSLVHCFDMRVYYPVAKYFHELGYDGLYLASVEAYLADVPWVTPESIANVEIRDLTDHRMTRIGLVMPQVRAVRSRFSDARWDAFRVDMRYFRQTMGVHDYLWSLTDHGGNATPVWIWVAHMIFAHTHASDAVLIATGLLDPLLLALLFAAIAYTFQLRTMLVCIVVFGATDMYMFGSNFAGSTLRDDWIVATGLGVCALRRERWMLGGVCLAYAALIRAFPAMALVLVTVPPLWWLAEQVGAGRRRPRWSELRVAWSPVAGVMLGAVATAIVFVTLSAVTFTFFGTWDVWLHKVEVLSHDAHLNHVGWRTIVAFDPSMTLRRLAALAGHTDWQSLQLATLKQRTMIYGSGIILLSAFTVVACRRKALYWAALAGMTLVPVWFYPANYYCHFIFLLPLLGGSFSSRDDARSTAGDANTDEVWVCFCVLAMCVAQYLVILGGKGDAAFFGQSIILIAGFVAMLSPAFAEGARDFVRIHPRKIAAGS